MEENKRIDMQLEIVKTGEYTILGGTFATAFYFWTHQEFFHTLLPIAQKLICLGLMLNFSLGLFTVFAVIGLLKAPNVSRQRKVSIHDPLIQMLIMLHVSVLIASFMCICIDLLNG